MKYPHYGFLRRGNSTHVDGSPFHFHIRKSRNNAVVGTVSKERELLLDLPLVLLLLHDLPVQLLTLLAEVLDALDLAVRALAKCCRVLGCLVQTLVLCSMPFTMCCEVLSFFCKVVLTGPDALDLAVRAKLHLANSEVFPLHLELPASAAKSLPTSGT